MAKLKGHKPGCRCVGCSPATRKRGQKLLQEWQRKNGRGGGTRSNPGGKGKGGARSNPGGKETGGARSNPSGKGRGRRSGGSTSTRTEVRVETKVVEKHVNVPAEVFDAKSGYLVTHGTDGRRIGGVKWFRTLKEVKEFVKALNKGFAVVSDLRAVGRA